MSPPIEIAYHTKHTPDLVRTLHAVELLMVLNGCVDPTGTKDCDAFWVAAKKPNDGGKLPLGI